MAGLLFLAFVLWRDLMGLVLVSFCCYAAVVLFCIWRRVLTDGIVESHRTFLDQCDSSTRVEGITPHMGIMRAGRASA